MSAKKKRGDKADKGKPQTLTGKFIFANGDTYDGEYVTPGSGSGHCISRQGRGTQELTNGMTYTGVWAGDRMSGEGLMEHPNGSSYKGDFHDNQYHGRGVYCWPNGASFEGTFEHNRITGPGEYRDQSGKIWTGQFAGKLANDLRFKIT